MKKQFKKALYWAVLVAIAFVASLGLKITENGNRCTKAVRVVKSYLGIEVLP